MPDDFACKFNPVIPNPALFQFYIRSDWFRTVKHLIRFKSCKIVSVNLQRFERLYRLGRRFAVVDLPFPFLYYRSHDRQRTHHQPDPHPDRRQ